MARSNIIMRNIYVSGYICFSSYSPHLTVVGGGDQIPPFGKKHPRPPFQLINIKEWYKLSLQSMQFEQNNIPLPLTIRPPYN